MSRKSRPFGKCNSYPIAKVECKKRGVVGFACYTHVERVHGVVSKYGNTKIIYPPKKLKRGDCCVFRGLDQLA